MIVDVIVWTLGATSGELNLLPPTVSMSSYGHWKLLPVTGKLLPVSGNYFRYDRGRDRVYIVGDES